VRDAFRRRPLAPLPSRRGATLAHAPPRKKTPTKKKQITKDARIKRKPVDDALADDEASWQGAATTQVACPKQGCESSRAAFIEVQIRSADEPATLFYKCVSCGHMWRDG
jgi:DNA-directed RNA polymerase subunit M/transcription elongation factor TFIIS